MLVDFIRAIHDCTITMTFGYTVYERMCFCLFWGLLVVSVSTRVSFWSGGGMTCQKMVSVFTLLNFAFHLHFQQRCGVKSFDEQQKLLKLV